MQRVEARTELEIVIKVGQSMDVKYIKIED